MGEEQVSKDSHRVTSRILDTLVQVVHKASFIDNQPVDLDCGSLLSAAEIHLIDMAGRFPSDNMSELAARLGVTKGAVSQMVQRLEKKGYLTRTREGENRKNICLHLTGSGRIAYDWHRSLHRDIDEQILSVLSDLQEKEQLRVLEIISRLSTALDVSREVREAHTREFLKNKGQ